MELNPGPVEAGKQLTVYQWKEGGRGDVPRGMEAFHCNNVFEFLCLAFSFPRLTGKQTCAPTSSHGSGVSCRVVYLSTTMYVE